MAKHHNGRPQRGVTGLRAAWSGATPSGNQLPLGAVKSSSRVRPMTPVKGAGLERWGGVCLRKPGPGVPATVRHHAGPLRGSSTGGHQDSTKATMKTVRPIGLAQKLEFLTISTNSCTDNRMRATAKQCPQTAQRSTGKKHQETQTRLTAKTPGNNIEPGRTAGAPI